MAKFLILYRAKVTAAEQMRQSDPEQAQAGMQAWIDWAQKAGEAVLDLGSPLGVVDAAGDGGDPIGRACRPGADPAVGRLPRLAHERGALYCRGVLDRPLTLFDDGSIGKGAPWVRWHDRSAPVSRRCSCGRSRSHCR